VGWAKVLLKGCRAGLTSPGERPASRSLIRQ